MVCNIGLSLLLAPKLGVSGLALSFAISSVINFLTLNFLLHRHLSKLKFNIFASLIKIIFASISAGLISYLALHAFEPIFNNATLVGLFFQTAISSIIGIVVYLSISYLLNIEELFLFFKIFRLSSFTNIFKK
jgi:peptidoglycan biosynthesis protein MviN/MurJ (putative lipid II flippase)